MLSPNRGFGRDALSTIEEQYTTAGGPLQVLFSLVVTGGYSVSIVLDNGGGFVIASV